MDDNIKRALEQDRTIDITTKGRKSGQFRKTEIWFHNLDGRLFITGTPGPRSWHANLITEPEFTFHLKQSVQADIPARATIVTNEAERRAILRGIIAKLGGDRDIDEWVKGSPLVEVTLDTA